MNQIGEDVAVSVRGPVEYQEGGGAQVFHAPANMRIHRGGVQFVDSIGLHVITLAHDMVAAGVGYS